MSVRSRRLALIILRTWRDGGTSQRYLHAGAFTPLNLWSGILPALRPKRIDILKKRCHLRLRAIGTSQRRSGAGAYTPPNLLSSILPAPIPRRMGIKERNGT